MVRLLRPRLPISNGLLKGLILKPFGGHFGTAETGLKSLKFSYPTFSSFFFSLKGTFDEQMVGIYIPAAK